jgi:hypothetical protein
MNPLRSKAMIASAMSFVRPIRSTGKRRATANDAGVSLGAASNEQFGPGRNAAIPDVNPIDPASPSIGAERLVGSSGAIGFDATATRAGATSYSLIGW